MLLVDVSQIPPEGLEVRQELAAGDLHVEGEDSFALEAGGRLDCRVERAEDATVHVRGRLAARLRLQCGRCLEPFSLPLEHELDLFYLPHQEGAGDEDDVELDDRDMVVAFYRDQRLDLGDTVREQLFLSLPMRRLCREGCRGLCPACGSNRNQASCQCPDGAGVDPRLAQLARLLGKGSS